MSDGKEKRDNRLTPDSVSPTKLTPQHAFDATDV